MAMLRHDHACNPTSGTLFKMMLASSLARECKAASLSPKGTHRAQALYVYTGQVVLQVSESIWQTYKGLSFLPAISCQSKDLHTEVVKLVDDLLQTCQVVAADWAMLTTVHNNQLPLAGGGSDLDHTTLEVNANAEMQCSDRLDERG